MIDLWRYIKGERDFFPVSILPELNVHGLKEAIFVASSGSFVGHKPKDLILTKVCYVMIYVNIYVITNGLGWLMTSVGQCRS